MRRKAFPLLFVPLAGLLLAGSVVVAGNSLLVAGQGGRAGAAPGVSDLPYTLLEWPTPPTSAAGVPGAWNFIQVASVAVTPRGTILVLHRGAHPIMYWPLYPFGFSDSGKRDPSCTA